MFVQLVTRVEASASRLVKRATSEARQGHLTYTHLRLGLEVSYNNHGDNQHYESYERNVFSCGRPVYLMREQCRPYQEFAKYLGSNNFITDRRNVLNGILFEGPSLKGCIRTSGPPAIFVCIRINVDIKLKVPLGSHLR